jgi:hypothetical protein
MLESLSVPLRPLFAQQLDEIVVSLGEAGIPGTRLLELDLGFSELLSMHELDALVIDFCHPPFCYYTGFTTSEIVKSGARCWLVTNHYFREQHSTGYL